MDEVMVVKQAIDRGIRDDVALKTLLKAMVVARGYSHVAGMLQLARSELSDGVLAPVSVNGSYEQIYG